VPNSRILQTRDSASFRYHDNDSAPINTAINIEQGLYSLLGLIAMFSMLIGRLCGTAFEIVFGLPESLLNVNMGSVVLVRWAVVGFIVYIAWWYAVQSQEGRSLAVGWIMSVSLLSSLFFSWHRSLPFRPIGAAFQLDINNCANSAHRDRTWLIRSL
jgi:phage shock protein PspC (stress-responsive transcriptional regulator)